MVYRFTRYSHLNTRSTHTHTTSASQPRNEFFVSHRLRITIVVLTRSREFVALEFHTGLRSFYLEVFVQILQEIKDSLRLDCQLVWYHRHQHHNTYMAEFLRNVSPISICQTPRANVHSRRSLFYLKQIIINRHFRRTPAHSV